MGSASSCCDSTPPTANKLVRTSLSRESSSTTRVSPIITRKPTVEPSERLPCSCKIDTLPYERINVQSLNQAVNDVNFDDIVDQAISLEVDTTQIKTEKNRLKTAKHNQKEGQDYPPWNDKYYVHGSLSDVVADVKGETHGCFASTISQNLDHNFQSLHDINGTVATVLQNRVQQISTKEQTIIDKFLRQRDDLIGQLLQKGRSYANQYEILYRNLIKEFITHLEIEMSKHLDELQRQIESDKQSILIQSNNTIQIVTQIADTARDTVYNRLQQMAARKRQLIMNTIESSHEDKPSQPLGYEQIRKLNVEIYSTVGIKNADQGCDNKPERDRFIHDLDKVKPPLPRMKRTIYLNHDIDQQ